MHPIPTTLVKADVCNQPLNVFGQFPWSECQHNTSTKYKCLILAYGRHSLLRYTCMWIQIKLFHMQHNILTKTSHSILKYELEFLAPAVCHKNTVDFNCTGWRLALRTPSVLTLYTMDIAAVVKQRACFCFHSSFLYVFIQRAAGRHETLYTTTKF